MVMRRQLICVAATLLAAGILVVPAFAAKTLNWNETFKNADGKVLNFRITNLAVTRTGWSAHVSFENLSKQTVQIGNGFGIAFFADAKTTNPVHASALAQATTFSPKRPTALKPGASWTGVIGGSGQFETAKTSGYTRILFGPFTGVPGQKAATSWITNHETPIATTSLNPGEIVA
jgi:hypothetical protein